MLQTGFMATVVSVNAGMPREVSYKTSSLPTTAIEKHPVEGPITVTAAGVAGNASADTRVHSDEFMKVYAYSMEDYSWWSAELGTDGLKPGLFGEQLTTEGIDLSAALVGETWRIGTALLQIAHVRMPCLTFQGWMRYQGFDATGWVKRFALAGRPGPYFRVLEEGVLEAGDPILIEDRPEHGVSVAELFSAVSTSPELLARVAKVPGLKPWVYERAEAQSRR